MKSIIKNFLLGAVLVFAVVGMSTTCKKVAKEITKPDGNPATASGDVNFWLTKGDQSVLLQKQNVNLTFGTTSNRYSTITVDTTQTFQNVDGFGYTLTGASPYLINHMSTSTRDALLRELFANDSNSISINYLRISIGSSDLNTSVFSYDDVPAGQTDVNLQNFSLAPDQTDLIPVLKLILAINPNIKILGSPWSPPAWMKDNKSTIGGSLLPQSFSVYGKSVVKYIQVIDAQEIRVDTGSPQTLPLNPINHPILY